MKTGRVGGVRWGCWVPGQRGQVVLGGVPVNRVVTVADDRTKACRGRGKGKVVQMTWDGGQEARGADVEIGWRWRWYDSRWQNVGEGECRRGVCGKSGLGKGQRGKTRRGGGWARGWPAEAGGGTVRDMSSRGVRWVEAEVRGPECHASGSAQSICAPCKSSMSQEFCRAHVSGAYPANLACGGKGRWAGVEKVGPTGAEEGRDPSRPRSMAVG